MKRFGITVLFDSLLDDVSMDDVKRMASDVIMSIPDETPVEDTKVLNIHVGNARRVPKEDLQ
jgi:hypothetical protein